MNQVSMIFLGIWFVLLMVIIGYWGNLAWFHPETLKQRLKQNPERQTDRVRLLRVVTLIGVLSLIILAIFFLSSLFGIP